MGPLQVDTRVALVGALALVAVLLVILLLVRVRRRHRYEEESGTEDDALRAEARENLQRLAAQWEQRAPHHPDPGPADDDLPTRSSRHERPQDDSGGGRLGRWRSPRRGEPGAQPRR